MRIRRLRLPGDPSIPDRAVAPGRPGAWMLGCSDNFGVVEPGRLYRSGQMGGASLASKLREHRIRTVLNLRGSHPETAWYRDERAATLDGRGHAGRHAALVVRVDVAGPGPRPLLASPGDGRHVRLLVHCFHGSERTGLVAAYAELLRPGSTLADARDQFTLRYLYSGIGDGGVTAEHLDQYEGVAPRPVAGPRPDHFRRWVAEGFQPGKPSREQWAFDPYPLVVVTRGSSGWPPSRRAGLALPASSHRQVPALTYAEKSAKSGYRRTLPV